MTEIETEMFTCLQRDIEELQAWLEFQADNLASLDKVVAEQDQLLLRQQRQMLLLAEKFKQLEGRVEQGVAAPVDQRPPHY